MPVLCIAEAVVCRLGAWPSAVTVVCRLCLGPDAVAEAVVVCKVETFL